MDNRSLILTQALELFAARGYDAIGVQEIAEAAGVTKPTLYHYFGSKHGLLQALLETYHTPLTEAVRQAADYHGDLPLSLTLLARAYFEAARQHPVFYRLQLALNFSARQSEAFLLAKGYNEQQYAYVEALFEAAVRDHGNMRGRQRVYAALFVGELNTCIGLWLNGYTELDEALVYRTVHQFQHGIYS